MDDHTGAARDSGLHTYFYGIACYNIGAGLFLRLSSILALLRPQLTPHGVFWYAIL